MNTVNIEDILASNLDLQNETIEATFKKTVLIKQYETEVIEMKTSLTVNQKYTGAQRVLIVSILKAQLEYAAYSDLLFRQLITQEEYNIRKKEIIDTINALKVKAEQVLGKSLDYLFKTL